MPPFACNAQDGQSASFRCLALPENSECLLVVIQNDLQIRVFAEGVHVIQKQDIGEAACAGKRVDVLVIIPRVDDFNLIEIFEHKRQERIRVGVFEDQELPAGAGRGLDVNERMIAAEKDLVRIVAGELFHLVAGRNTLRFINVIDGEVEILREGVDFDRIRLLHAIPGFRGKRSGKGAAYRRKRKRTVFPAKVHEITSGKQLITESCGRSRPMVI